MNVESRTVAAAAATRLARSAPGASLASVAAACGTTTNTLQHKLRETTSQGVTSKLGGLERPSITPPAW